MPGSIISSHPIPTLLKSAPLFLAIALRMLNVHGPVLVWLYSSTIGAQIDSMYIYTAT